MTQLSTGANEYLNTQLFKAMLGCFPKGQALAAASGIAGIQSGVIEEFGDKERFVKEGPRYTLRFRRACGRAAFSRAVSIILDNSGIPVELSLLEQEINAVFPSDRNAVSKLRTHLSDAKTFFKAGKLYGLARWLLVPCGKEDFADMNGITDEEAERWSAELPMGADFEKSLAALSAGEPVSMRGVQYMAWKAAGEAFDPVAVYEAVLKARSLCLLSDGCVYSDKSVKAFAKELAAAQKEMGDSPADPLTEDDIILPKSAIDDIIAGVISLGCYPLEEAIEKNYEAEDTGDESKLALIKDYLFDSVQDPRIDHSDSQWFVKVDFDSEDADEIAEYVTEKGSATAEEIISEFLNIPMEHAMVPALKRRLSEIMSAGEKVMAVGETYTKAVKIPDWAKTMPEALIYKEPEPVEDMEGEMFDCALEPEGFDPALRTEIYNPLAEDYGDEDPSRTIYAINETRQRCVLKYHHKIAGTFPMCQIQPGFFGIPDNAEVVPVLISGKTVYVNKSCRLILGMNDFYSGITQVSGTVFYINKTPGGYELEITGETEKNCAIDTNRSLELLELAEQDNLTVFDIICHILSRKPLSFVALCTEVNIVRRCSRLLVASILSSYHCFNVKGKSGLWAYDEKKIDQGFNKNKKKYIRK